MKPAETPNGLTWAILLAVLALGFGLRAYGLGTYWVNPDEGIYFSTVTSQDSSIFWQEVGENAHPPLFYLLLRTFATLTSDFVVLRSLSCLLGCLAIFGAFLAVREVCGRDTTGAVAGIATALAVAVSPAMIELSTLIRPYMLQVSALFFALYYLARCLKDGSSRAVAGYAVSISIALLTHYSSLLALGAIGITLALLLICKQLNRRQVRLLAIAHAGPFLLILGLYCFHLRPNLMGSALQQDAFASWLRPFTVQTWTDPWRLLFSFFTFLSRELADIGVLLLFVAIGLAIRKRRPLVFGLPLAALLVAIAAAAAKKYPLGSTRHSIYLAVFLLPPVAWLLARGLTSGKRALIATLAAAGLLGLARNHIAPLLGSSKTDRQLLVSEHLLTVADCFKMQDVFERIRRSPDILLMSKQSYYLLMPLYHREREKAVWSEDRKFFRFRWGKTDVFVADIWEFRVEINRVADKIHLMQLVNAVDRASPEVRLSKRRAVWMLFGGWSERTPLTLLDNDKRVPESSKLLESVRSVPGLQALRFRLSRYVRGIRSR